MAGTSQDPLRESHLEAIHNQRIEWMKTRVAAPLPGIYQDFRSVAGDQSQIDAARSAGVNVFYTHRVSREIRDGVLILEEPADWPKPTSPGRLETKGLKSEFKQFPEELFPLAGEAVGPHPELRFRSFSTHVLARELSADSIAQSIRDGRTYTASDWLCDPAGFFFIAETVFGVYDIGDHAPARPDTRLRVNLPIMANISIEHDGRVVAAATTRQFSLLLKESGDYKMRATLTVDGETFPWLATMPIHIDAPAQLVMPESNSVAQNVRTAIPYAGDGLDQHKLDLYLPEDKRNFPVLVFLHGGAWRSGDRSQYSHLGLRFARAGIGVAIPNYRLMPKDPYPAQPDDAAAAFKWVYQHIAEYGGDSSRVYLAGHSSGGHLATLIALDPKYGLSRDTIRGVISISGIYRVGGLPQFQNADDDPSPIDHARMSAPPFLLTYCQWDDFDLPKQARDFEMALQSKFVPARLVYVAGENHVSEIIDTWKPDDATGSAILDFIR